MTHEERYFIIIAHLGTAHNTINSRNSTCETFLWSQIRSSGLFWDGWEESELSVGKCLKEGLCSGKKSNT